MRGHAAIIAMRRQGISPRVVNFDLDRPDSWWCRNWQHETPRWAHVCVGPQELISGLDLRFVVGLIVLVTGENAARVERVTKACLEAGAARVVSAHVTTEPDPRAEFGHRGTAHSITDHEGRHATSAA